MIKEIKGNLLEAKEEIIAHQVNCCGVMGAGIAKQIRKHLLSEEQFDEYAILCKSYGSALLGNIQPSSMMNGKYVVNLFGEDKPTEKGRDTDYKALRKSLKLMAEFALVHHLSIAIPGYLGCGLAGGDWEVVYNMICQVADIYRDVEITIYYIPESIKMLWNDFGNVPMNPDTECIEEDWHGFPAGTFREDIWHWFEDAFDICVATDLMFS